MNTPGAASRDMGMLRAMFDITPDAMLAVDRDGRIVLANAQAEQLFGYAPGALLRQPLDALLPAPLRYAHTAHFREYLDRPQVRRMGIDYELRGMRRDGTAVAVEVSLSPVRTELGPLALASIRDVSGTSRVQRSVERARLDRFVVQIGRLLLESADHWEAIARIPEQIVGALEVDAVAVLSSDWQRRELAVRAASGLPGDAAELLAGIFTEGGFIRHFFVTQDLPAVTLEALDNGAFGAAREALRALGFEDCALVPLFGVYEPSGVLAVLSRSPRRFDHDSVSFLQSIANLLASAVQRRRTELQLAHAQRLEAVGQLTGGIAHDFNNLLTVISGNLQLLELELDAQGPAAESIASARHAVERGADLTRKLLAFARRQPLRPVATAVGPLLESLGRLLARTLGETIQLEFDVPGRVAGVYADPAGLETALLNLAINARDAMPRGGRLRISVRDHDADGTEGSEEALRPGRYVAFAVADTGTGMSADVLERVLEPFVTTKDASKGSGLGLPMVYGFVEQSGGGMHIDSRLGYGTRVELYLPAAGTEAAAVQPEEAAPVAHQAASVLVVEDEPQVRAVAVAFLKSLGYTVCVAADAEEALAQLAARGQVDLLFSDVVLGAGMDGIALARVARERQPDLPVLLTSGYPQGENPIAGAADLPEILPKPYRREELAAALARTLGQGRA